MTATKPAVHAPVGHRPALDGLRGVAIALVLWHHSVAVLLPLGFGHSILGGFLGVDLFFVLSGFLIATGLLDGRGGHVISWGDYFLRRAVRLLPALAFFLVGHALFAVLFRDDLAVEFRTSLLAVTYLSNLASTFGWQLAAGQGHLWSLAVEAQFYLLFPLLFCLLRGRRTRTALSVIGVLIVLVALRRSVMTANLDLDHSIAYERFDTRIDALLIGVALAYARRVAWRPSDRLAVAGAIVGGATIAMGVVGTTADSPILYRGGFTAVALGAATLIVVALRPGPARQLLSVRPIVRLGQLSYAVYLWHLLCFRVVTWVLGRGFVSTLLGLAFSISAAKVSESLVEVPARRAYRTRRRTRLQRAEPTITITGFPAGRVALGLAAAVGLIALVTLGPRGESRPSDADLAASGQESPEMTVPEESVDHTEAEPQSVTSLADGRESGASPDRPGGAGTVAPVPTSLAIVSIDPLSPATGGLPAVRVAATLRGASGQPLADRPLSFELTGTSWTSTCEARTDADGDASCELSLATATADDGVVVATAAFVGDASHHSSTARRTVDAVLPDGLESPTTTLMDPPVEPALHPIPEQGGPPGA